MSAVSKIKFSCEWQSAGMDDPEVRDTSGYLSIYVGEVCLTQSEDIWSRTVRNSALVSAYPLAMWLASSWWRLIHEPLPKMDAVPTVDWRMYHELGAANHGFVWPRILFATDGDAMQIWAASSKPENSQSVRYLNSLRSPATVSTADFEREVERFIGSVISRLHAFGYTETGLSALWRLVQEDRADADSARARRLEAQLGYDPDECPEDIMRQALSLEKVIGEGVWAELAPVFGQANGDVALGNIVELGRAPGLSGKPQVSRNATTVGGGAPWERAVDAARRLRKEIGNKGQPIGDRHLYELLGLTEASVSEWIPQTRQKVAIAVPTDEGALAFKPRKKHYAGRRFEFARFLGDWIAGGADTNRWLASTDLPTSRQKFQRAFAAEFLCPIESLADLLQDDFSETAIEEATEIFGVSEMTVRSLLANNGYIAPAEYQSELPYRLAA